MNDRVTHAKRIACIGEVMIELVAEGDDLARLNVAGDTYNTAVYLRRLLPDDVSVSYVTALGSDAFSDRILADIAHHGLETGHIERRTGKMPGLYAISTSDEGERSFSYWRSDSAARTLFQDPCEIGLDHLDDFDLLFLSGITVAILPPDIRAALGTYLDRFRAAGGIVAYDSNHRPLLWEDTATAQAVNMEMWARADIALPSVDDECALFGDPGEAEVLERLTGAGAQFGALKRGPEGPCALSGPAEDLSFPPVTQVIDTTAAGDSFNAGVLAALIRGEGLGQAMEAGHGLASRVIQTKGAILP